MVSPCVFVQRSQPAVLLEKKSSFSLEKNHSREPFKYYSPTLPLICPEFSLKSFCRISCVPRKTSCVWGASPILAQYVELSHKVGCCLRWLRCMGYREGSYSGTRECCQEKFPKRDITVLRGGPSLPRVQAPGL